MTGPAPLPMSDPPTKSPRTIRMRNAVILAAASLVVGFSIGAAGSNPAASAPSASAIAAATQAPSPTAVPTVATPSASGATVAVEPTPLPTTEPTPAPAKAVVVKGTGSQKTKPFNMPAGDFTVTITGNADGNVIVRLQLRGGDVFDGEGLFNEIANGKYKYETQIYGIDASSYYLDVTTDNAWFVTFTPLA